MKLISAILCDEVRREDTGKFLFIGVYTNDILVRRFPINISLTLWVHLSAPGTEKVGMEIRIREKGKPQIDLSKGTGNLTVENPDKDLFISFPTTTVGIAEPTTLVFEIKPHTGRWKKAIEIPVVQME